ncbi:MAG: sulfotransferase [Candidatus Hodarchaeota archaeon]
MIINNNTKKMFFIVGNSRSGNHLVSCILGNHPDVYTFPHEFHFFEELWSANDMDKMLTRENKVKIAAKLLYISRCGYLKQKNIKKYYDEAKKMNMNNINSSAGIFRELLYYETFNNEKKIPCEHTPRNLFYIDEILNLYPEAKIIIMIRDPRDVLLSQKKKWKRRYLTSKKSIPLREAIRSFINYHPFLIGKLWNSSIYVADRTYDEKKVLKQLFEDLVSEPFESVKKICEFLGLDFYEDMLDVPQMYSSNEVDRPNNRGINKKRVRAWLYGGLSSTEIFICQKITESFMRKYGYIPLKVKPNIFVLFYYFILLPIKTILALGMNLNRMKNVKDTIRRRLA